MHELKFVYVCYIATTPQALWQALTDSVVGQHYWHRVESSWQIGAPLTLWRPDGSVAVTGAVLVCDPARKLAFSFQAVSFEPGRAEKPSRVCLFIESVDEGIVRLTLTHDGFEPGSVVYTDIARRWPAFISGMKTLLETGRSLPFSAWP